MLGVRRPLRVSNQQRSCPVQPFKPTLNPDYAGRASSRPGGLYHPSRSRSPPNWGLGCAVGNGSGPSAPAGALAVAPCRAEQVALTVAAQDAIFSNCQSLRSRPCARSRPCSSAVRRKSARKILPRGDRARAVAAQKGRRPPRTQSRKRDPPKGVASQAAPFSLHIFSEPAMPDDKEDTEEPEDTVLIPDLRVVFATEDDNANAWSILMTLK